MPKIDHFKLIQKDSNNFYFKEIWILSKDVNSNDAAGFLRRAKDKIELGYYKEALTDINKTISIDSTIGVGYFIRGYILLKYDSLQAALTNFYKAISLKDTNVYNYYYAAEISMYLGKYNESDSLYNETIKKDEKFSAAYFGLGNLYFLKTEFKQAEIQYKKAIELNPDFSIAYFNLAMVYSLTDPDKAIRYLNKTIEGNPAFAPAYYIRGCLKLYQNKLPDVLKDWDKAIEIDPSNKLYHMSRAFLKIHKNQYNEGIDELLRSIGYSKSQNYVSDFEDSFRAQLASDFLSQIVTYNSYVPELPDIEKEKLIKAMCLFSLGKHSLAENIYKDLLKTTSSPGLVYYLRGFNLEYLIKNDLSLQSYLNAGKERSFPDEVFLRQGIVYYYLKEYPEAIHSLNVYIKNNDSTKLAYRSRANSYAQISEYDSAIYDYNNFLKLDSTELDIYFDRASCFKELEKYQEAIKDYLHVIKYKDRDLESICLLAECRYLSGDTTGSFNLLNQTFNKLHMLNETGYYLLGTINLAYMNYDSAVSNFDHIIRYNAKHINALTSRGLAYYYKKEYEKAKEDLTAALNLESNEMVALYARGLVNIKLNKLDEAYSDLQKAASLGHSNAKRAMLIYLKDFKPNNKVFH